MLMRMLPAALLLVCGLLLTPAHLRAQDPEGPTTSGEEVESDPIRLGVRIGFGDRSALVRVNRWHPVFVSVENRYKKAEQGLRGVLRVSRTVPASRIDRTTSETPIDLPAGSRKRLVLLEFVEQDDEEIHVELVTGRDVRVGDTVLLNDATRAGHGADQVLVVSPRPHALGWLEVRPRSGDAPQPFPMRFVQGVEPGDLPESWLGLDAIDTVVVDDPESLTLNAAQVSALASFVRLGGTLLVCCGRNSAVIARSSLAEQLPAVPAEDLEWSASSHAAAPDRALALALTSLSGHPIDCPTPFPGARLDVRRGEVRARAGSQAVCVVEHVGLGRTVVLAFSATEPALAGAVAAREAVRRVIGAATERSLPEPFPVIQSMTHPLLHATEEIPEGAIGAVPGAQARHFQLGIGWRDLLESAFVSDLLTPIPSWRLVATFLFAYFLCLVPINWLVFRTLDRKEYAWPMSIAIALLFSGLAYAYGLRGGESTLGSRYLTFIEAGSDGTEGRAYDLLGLASAGHLTGEVSIDAADCGVSRLRLRGDRQGHDNETIATRRTEAGAVLRDFRVLARAINGLEVQRRMPLGTGVTLRIERGIDRVHGVLRNGTGRTLRSPVVLVASAAVVLNDLPDGASIEFVGEDKLMTSAAQALAEWCAHPDLDPAFGNRSRAVLAEFLQQAAHGPLAVALIARLDHAGPTLHYGDLLIPGRGVSVLAVRAEASLARAGFALPSSYWRLRLVSASPFGNVTWQGWDGQFQSTVLPIRVAARPVCWSEDAILEHAAIQWSGPAPIRVSGTHWLDGSPGECPWEFDGPQARKLDLRGGELHRLIDPFDGAAVFEAAARADDILGADGLLHAELLLKGHRP